MAQNQESRATDEPEHETEWTCEPQQRDTDDKKTGVKALLGDDVFADLHGFWCEAVDGPETKDQEDDGEKKQSVVDHAIDGEKSDNDSIVAGEVTSVVCDTLESFVGVLWTRDALVIKELAERTQARETLLSQIADPLRNWT